MGPQAYRRRRTLCIRHLGSDGALPDQLIEFELVTVQFLGHLGGCAEGVTGRTDGLVGFLRTLGLSLVDAASIRHELGTVKLRGLPSRGVDRLIAQRRRVRTHIGDVTVLVQALGNLHGDP